MENKQTAVEWLIDKYFGGINNVTSNFRNYIEQAKQMEKEQIIDSHIHGDDNHTFNSRKIEEYANDYYNETYGKEES